MPADNLDSGSVERTEATVAAEAQTSTSPNTPQKIVVSTEAEADAAAMSEQQKKDEAARLDNLKVVLGLFVVFKILVSYDSGAFSSALAADGGITDELELSTSQQGALGSSVFLGNMFGCAFAAKLFSRYSAKKLLTTTIILHGVFTFCFAASDSYNACLVFRFMIGVTLAFIVVYSPIWVDEFAPQTSATLWMALCNVGVPIGIMIGFVVGGMLPTNTSLSWRWAFYLKTLAMIPLAAVVSNTDHRLIDEKAGHSHFAPPPPPTDEQPLVSEDRKFWDDIYDGFVDGKKVLSVLCRNGIFVSNVLALSSLYFVITALQVFITPYLRAPPFNAEMNTIVVGFGITVVSAPVAGVICGGVLLDRLGGYHGNIFKASVFSTCWGVAASIVSIACVFIKTTDMFLVVVWLLLFCGGAIVPPGTGLIMASIPEKLRAVASSVSAMAFNLFGYFLGPLVCGFVADQTSLTVSIRLVFLFSFVGLIPMLGSCYFSRHHMHKHPHPRHEQKQQQQQQESPPVAFHREGDSPGEDHTTTAESSGREMLSVDKKPSSSALLDTKRPPSIVVDSCEPPFSPPAQPASVTAGPIPEFTAASFGALPATPMRDALNESRSTIDLDTDIDGNASIPSFPNQYTVGMELVRVLHHNNERRAGNSSVASNRTPPLTPAAHAASSSAQ